MMIVLYNKMKVFCKKNGGKRIKMQYRSYRSHRIHTGSGLVWKVT